MSDKDRIVDGYLFNSGKDAENAKTELKKIAYIKERLDKNNPESMLQVYNKLVSKRIFTTPPGYRFLKDIQELLLTYPSIVPEDVMPLPLSFMMSLDKDIESRRPARKVIPEQKKDQAKDKFFISAVINVLLVIAIMAMMFITLKSDQPNILNYENALQNRYSAWEQELTERERAVREKENALGLEGGNSDGSD